MEEHILDTHAGKQLSKAATDVLLSMVLKKIYNNKIKTGIFTTWGLYHKTYYGNNLRFL
jgi:hypothetical protein